jgi:hypothetical protein
MLGCDDVPLKLVKSYKASSSFSSSSSSFSEGSSYELAELKSRTIGFSSKNPTIVNKVLLYWSDVGIRDDSVSRIGATDCILSCEHARNYCNPPG